MALVNAVCVAEVRVGAGDARPDGSMAEPCLRNFRQRVALPHGELCCRAAKRHPGGQINPRARLDVVRVANPWIEGEQLTPPRTMSEISLCKFPKGIARLYGHCIWFRVTRNGRRDGRGRARWCYANGRRVRRKDARRCWQQKLWPLKGRPPHWRPERSESRRGSVGNRRAQRLHRRLGGSERRRVGERKTELRGLLNLLRLFVFAEVTSDIAERRVGRKRLGVHGLLRFLRRRRSWLILPCLYLCAIFRRENLRALQILVGVHVLGFFLLTFLPRAFLACSLGDILSGASCRAKNEARR